MTTPTGLPAWTRSADHSYYGGDVNKTNYQSQGLINARTDVGAEHITRMAADLAACARTVPFATITFEARDSTSAHPLVTAVSMMTGVTVTTYVGNTPPSGFPSVTRTANGEHTIAFSSSYNDPYGVAGTFAPRHATSNANGTSVFLAMWEISGNNVLIHSKTTAGAAFLDGHVTVEVW